MNHSRILIIRPDRIGDVVLITPLIRAVKKTFPESFIGVMVSSNNIHILKNNPYIDKIITDDPKGNDSGKSGFWTQVKTLRMLKFDTGLMPLPQERHAWMMLFAGIRTRIGVGGKIYQILTATQSVSRNKYIPLRHESDYVLDLGRKIGILSDDLAPEIFVTNEEQKKAKKFFEDRGIDFTKPLIGINPSSRGSAPNWIPEKYLTLAQELSKEYQLFINVGPNNHRLEKYFENLRHSAIIYTREDLRELISLVSQLSLLISPSTGTMHIAAALKIPTITMFCPLTACSPKLWGPIGNKSEIVLPPEGYCQGRCPGNPKICTFDEIDVFDIVHRVKNVMKT